MRGVSCGMWIAAVAVVFAATSGTSPTAAGRQSSAGEQTPAIADLRGALGFVSSVHPAPFRHIPRGELLALVDREADRLAAIEEPTDLDVGRSLQRVLARIGDGHLAVALPSFQPAAADALRVLPLLPKRVGMRVMVDASEPQLPPGTELLAIDSRPIDEIFDELAALALVDGLRAEVRRAHAERYFTQHFTLLVGQPASYEVKLRSPDGAESIQVFQAVHREVVDRLAATRRSAPVWGPASTERPPLPWRLESVEGVAHLRLPTFGVPDQDAYRDRVGALFSRLEGSETLLLDLRGNTGGLRTNGIVLLEHLLEGPYTQWSSIAVRVREIPEQFLARVVFPFTPPEALSGFPGRPQGDRFVFEGDPLASIMQGAGATHAGPVVAFIDDATSSAAVEMIAALRANRGDVRLVGTETGGECDRHVGEIPVMFTTTHFAIRLLVSLAEITHVAAPGCSPGRGFEPDERVDYRMDDFLQRRDPFVAAATELSARRRP